MLTGRRSRSLTNLTVKKNLISIIVPIYNAQKYLNRCIDSILSQSYDNFELILINDGSTDGSKDICENYSSKDSRIKLINKINEGVSAARNIGLDIAEGEYVTFIDSDDWIENNYLQAMIDAIDGFDIVISSFTEVYELDIRNRGYNKELNNAFETRKAIYKDFVDDCVKRKIYTYIIWGKLYRKDVINGLRFTELKYSEDALFFRTLVNACPRINFIKNQGYYYYINSSGATSNKNKSTEIVYGSMCMLQLFYELYSVEMEKDQRESSMQLLKQSVFAYLRSAIKTGNVVTYDATVVVKKAVSIILHRNKNLSEILYITILLFFFQIRMEGYRWNRR